VLSLAVLAPLRKASDDRAMDTYIIAALLLSRAPWPGLDGGWNLEGVEGTTTSFMNTTLRG